MHKLLTLLVTLIAAHPVLAQLDKPLGHCENWLVVSFEKQRAVTEARCEKLDEPGFIVARHRNGVCLLCEPDEWSPGTADLSALAGDWYGTGGQQDIRVVGSEARYVNPTGNLYDAGFRPGDVGIKFGPLNPALQNHGYSFSYQYMVMQGGKKLGWRPPEGNLAKLLNPRTLELYDRASGKTAQWTR